MGMDVAQGMPKMDRKFISIMLNSTFEFKWTVAADGAVRVEHGQEFRKCTNFGGLTKHADSFQLDELLEIRQRREAQAAEAEERRAKGLPNHPV